MQSQNLTQKILCEHLADGELIAGSPIAIRIDQTLTQDATGTMAYLQFEAMGLERVRTELSVSYVDHNTLQSGYENADDHLDRVHDTLLMQENIKTGLILGPYLKYYPISIDRFINEIIDREFRV